MIRSMNVPAMLLLLLALLLQTPAWAEGDGSGGGSGIPLELAESQPVDGTADVELQPVIACRFTHNVAMGPHAGDNLGHLLLERADGTPVAAQPYVEDAQLDFDQRRFLYLRPLEPLEPGETYVVRLTPGIRAKNGMETVSEQSFRFTTAPAPEPEPALSAEPVPLPTAVPAVTAPPVTASPAAPAPTPTPEPTAAPEPIRTVVPTPEVSEPVPESAPELPVPSGPAAAELPVSTQAPAAGPEAGPDLSVAVPLILILPLGILFWLLRRHKAKK